MASSSSLRKQNQGSLLGGMRVIFWLAESMLSESVVASIHGTRGPSYCVVSSEPVDGGGDEEQIRDLDKSEVVADSNDLAPGDTTAADMREDGDAEGVVVNNSNGSCWTRRVRIGKASKERDANPSRIALEASMRAYADNKAGTVVNQALGTSFDTVEEAYEFSNLYSWETGFGVRYAKSRLNVHRTKCMQESVCACAGKLCRVSSFRIC